MTYEVWGIADEYTRLNHKFGGKLNHASACLTVWGGGHRGQGNQTVPGTNLVRTKSLPIHAGRPWQEKNYQFVMNPGMEPTMNVRGSYARSSYSKRSARGLSARAAWGMFSILMTCLVTWGRNLDPREELPRVLKAT
ncbi:MAG: hypothetical protein D9C04_02395 [Nitrosopumilus sp. B06]|nr:MAG: hypothetical protein EB828_03830 [Nitrosopumilus sp. D6]RNJ80192.1 MAG: hypothetical protein D9C04_02395 [Nitrosopumilus sp. B06]